MEVVIIKSANPKYWYANRVGESFHVLPSVKSKHRVDVRFYPDQKFLAGFFINVEDCSILKEKVSEEEKYNFACAACECVFKEAVGVKSKCPYCKEMVMTNCFSETDSIGDIGTTSIVELG